MSSGRVQVLTSRKIGVRRGYGLFCGEVARRGESANTLSTSDIFIRSWCGVEGKLVRIVFRGAGGSVV